LIKAGAYKNKSGDKQCFYELGNSVGKNWRRKIGSIFPELNAQSTQLPPLAFSPKVILFNRIER
jgi:hypothetical protein